MRKTPSRLIPMAQRVETDLLWEDLAVDDATRERLEQLVRWLEEGDARLASWATGAIPRPGYRALFTGPSGTGKTLAAALLGRRADRAVYRIDLSTVISKYIGETEKNLEVLFGAAHGERAILLFDEADALFGRRSGVEDAHDRYANQEVSHLLARLDAFDGLSIFAATRELPPEPRVARRFEMVLRFLVPGPDERRQIWTRLLGKAVLGPGVDLRALADEHELSGGSIANAVRAAALSLDGEVLTRRALDRALREEHARMDGST